MKTLKSKPDILTIFVRGNGLRQLIDMRPGTYGQVFGTVDNVAQQYGIKVEVCDKYLKCSAPKNRLQMFVEKLHFAMVGYQESI